jgi:hypothetical protein
MNTKTIEKPERKKLKRAARKKAAPKAKRAAGEARGAAKKKIRRVTQGQRKR